MIMEMIHTRKASLPVVPAMPPMEKSTRGGTPAATQNAPFQSMARFRTLSPFAVVVALLTDIVPSPRFKSHSGCESPAAGIDAACRYALRRFQVLLVPSPGPNGPVFPTTPAKPTRGGFWPDR